MFSLAAYVVLLLVRHAQLRDDEPRYRPVRKPAVGLATTSVLIYAARDQATFVLILNTNFNQSRGIWLSPGGHYDPTDGDPVTNLLSKVADETGLVAERWGTSAAGKDDDMSNEDVTWLCLPDYILQETLPGPCRLGHDVHLDLVYICQTAGVSVPGVQPKYRDEKTIHVPLAECATSSASARAIVAQAVDDRDRKNTGRPRAVQDSISRDVCDRLHMAACRYLAQSSSS